MDTPFTQQGLGFEENLTICLGRSLFFCLALKLLLGDFKISILKKLIICSSSGTQSAGNDAWNTVERVESCMKSDPILINPLQETCDLAL